jgi:hypothetical protein
MIGLRQKVAVVFRPKRQWKPKRRERNVVQRLKRKRWWKKNKRQLRHNRAFRRKLLKNNSLFKNWRKQRYQEREKRKLRLAFEEVFRRDEVISLDRGKDPAPETVTPEIWFIFPHEERDGTVSGVAIGYVVDYDPDTEELLIYDVSNEAYFGVQLPSFLNYVVFLEEADGDNFELFLDQFYGEEEEDLDLIPEEKEAPEDLEETNFPGASVGPKKVVAPAVYPRPVVVASRWLKGRI